VGREVLPAGVFGKLEAQLDEAECDSRSASLDLKGRSERHEYLESMTM
jgi:hypothetical protein